MGSSLDAAAATLCHHACDVDFVCIAKCATTAFASAAAPTGVTVQDVGGTFVLLCFSGLFSGLTLGLMSLDVGQLELKIAGGSEDERKQAEKILPLRRRGNLLLCTLLLGNTLVNAGIAILTASFTSGFVGGLLSTGFILIFGEIIPQSVCSRYGLAAGAKAIDLVRLFLLLLFPFAFPMSKVLDRVLGDELGTVYTRTELKELITKQAKALATAPSDDNLSESDRTQSGGPEGEGGHGKIGVTEATFMCGVLSLSERTSEQIMTKMPDVFGLCASRARVPLSTLSLVPRIPFRAAPLELGADLCARALPSAFATRAAGTRTSASTSR